MQGSMDKTRIKSFFDTDAWHRRYERNDMQASIYRDRLSAAVELLAKHGSSDARVLDAGCGAGQLSALLVARKYAVVSCDLSAEMVARTRAARVQAGDTTPDAIVADIEYPPFGPHSFDAILLIGVISYVAHPGALLRRLRKLIRPGGLLVVSSANTGLLYGRIGDKLSALTGRTANEPPVERVQRSETAAGESGRQFYREHCRYYRARDFNAMVGDEGYRFLEAVGLGFGRMHLGGRYLLPERSDLALSRLTSRFTRAKPLRFVNDYAFVNVACFRVE
jgi:SAM-dependent methyltransferase